ncbi:carbohydrate ABC transporter permease [Athalassotoga saccharophila]|uniref:carbohydrate ABC transporter permease n=1 Tax=Athalassotoga saccharophila TaxID=1441386 RepID=UPI00137B2087|nr:carbohydrate ABC transporter permease [Athalassotoga saccharophila]BBJ28938.1 L-arabinose transport system permease protein AraQ [Athalassotoga saccharophila]
MKKSKKYKTFRAIMLSIYLIAAIIPIYWIILTSLKVPSDLYAYPIIYFPKVLTLSNYSYLFSFAHFSIYFKNSLLLSAISSIISTLLSIFSGYALARYNFKLKDLVIGLLFFSQMIPAYLLMVPQYSMFSNLGLINSLTALGILYVNIAAAFSTIMARGFFVRIPRSLEEAAMIDGCSKIGALFRITVPLAMPGIAAIFSFSFINDWNELFTAALFLNSDDKYTIPVALYSFISKAGIQWGVLSAGLVVALIPTIIVFAFMQRFIISGLTQGALKE